jgi:alginate O-acetyltransferase complex protein AlgI
MLFSSSIFLFFFLPLVIIGYQLLKENFRIYFLMLASLFFYAWGEPKYILVMVLSITINYVFGVLINYEKKKWGRRIWLFLAVICNLAILFYFKYLNFTIANINRFLHTDFVYHNIVMPIGISFCTFQGMSYVIDLYYKKVKVQTNPAIVAFYIAFFPQLISGPIVRYLDIEEQIFKRTESFKKFAEGVRRFIIGLSKKVIIANTVGYTADQIFANTAGENAIATVWLGIICYTFQIFFDFSGYSDMAIGLGKIFGFDFRENFNYPYISKTVTEFWRRWHISLSTWFRDYLYIPLGGSRKGNVYINLLIVFIITGFWHGASFNFLVWGLWHGLFLIIERALKLTNVEKKAFIPLRYVMTMFVVIIGWVFFRIEGLREAFKYLGVMFGLIRPENVVFTVYYYLDAKIIIALSIAVIASIPVAKMGLFNMLRQYTVCKYASTVISLILFFISAVFVVASSYNPFIYFRF